MTLNGIENEKSAVVEYLKKQVQNHNTYKCTKEKTGLYRYEFTRYTHPIASKATGVKQIACISDVSSMIKNQLAKSLSYAAHQTIDSYFN